MIYRFLTKNHWANSKTSIWFYTPVCMLVWLGAFLPNADARTRYTYSGKASARPAYHLREPMGMASERLALQFEQIAEYSKQTKIVAGLSAWNEPIYSQYTDRYPSDVNKYDSYDLRMRDVYLQYQVSRFVLRAGSQQVVWGETFGQFYSDIVNPKDYRNGLFGDISDSRLNVPMLNAKFIFNKISLQGIFIPKPFFSILSMPGGDYAFPFKQYFPSSTVQVRRQTDLSATPENFEYGGRLTSELNGYDFSVFYFDYYDRLPTYSLSSDSAAPQSVILDENHHRVRTLGLTMTKEWSGFIVRAEALKTFERRLSTLSGNNLSSAQLDNDIYVLSVDIPTIRQTNISIQLSADILNDNPTGILRPKTQSFGAVRIQRPLFQDQEIELIYSHSMTDHGQRAQLTYKKPLSSSLETQLGVDWLEGKPDSEFGRIKAATRAFVLLTYYFKR